MRLRAVVIAASALLTSCSMVSGGVAPQAAAHSRVSEGVPGGNLLYVSGPNRPVNFYSYPGLGQAGTLSGVASPHGTCVDATGNVWITDYGFSSNQVVEYAHGATQPTTELQIAGAQYCSVDPTSGDVAVITGELAIFAKGKAPARFYSKPHTTFKLCTYDNQGNLFIEARAQSGFKYGAWSLLELRKRSRHFQTITFSSNSPLGGGSMLWDGQALVFGAQGGGIGSYKRDFYRVSISGKVATVTGTTMLTMPRLNHRRNLEPLSQYWISGSTIVGPDARNGESTHLGIWKYPAGGTRLKSIDPGVGTIYGVSVSP